jgi:UDP-N-acetylmuramoyl-tripeptide--D-alanyl-D-alanine ligase
MKITNINKFAKYFEHEIVKKGNENLLVKGVSTDTRTIEEGTVFLPLCGDNFNGHDFIPDALKKGACAVIVGQGENFDLNTLQKEDLWVFSVKDTLLAYQEIAASYLLEFKNLKKIGITGTSGKTTTKEIIKSILSAKYKVHANYANFNNRVGVPKTALEVEPDHDVVIFEMGMGAPFDIDILSKIVKPDISIITSIGEGHLEFFDSIEDIARTKKGIFKYSNENGYAILSINTNLYSILIQNIKIKLIKFDEKNSEKIHVLKDNGIEGYEIEYSKENVHYPLGGAHNLINLHFGIYVGEVLGLKKEDIIKGIENISVPGMRNQIKKGEYTIIVDCYNANPSSMKVSLDFFNTADNKKNGNKIAVLGDMLELGKSSPRLHFEVGKHIGEECADIDYVFLFGTLSKNILEGLISGSFDREKVFYFDDKNELNKKLKKTINKNDMILFKASRGMKLEEVADNI